MAKKSTSPAKKASKSAGKPIAKTAKSAEKVAAKPAKKAEVKPAKKAVTKAPEVAKPPAKKAETKGKDSKSATTPAAAKSIEKTPAAKPALMTKKGKPEEPLEVSPAAAVAPAKAEKASKVKPIRIEKGNAEDEKAKWAELFKKYGKDKAISYKMSDSFPNLSPLQHKVLGWGFILKNDNDRLEVLFETGIRMLISNYKSS